MSNHKIVAKDRYFTHQGYTARFTLVRLGEGRYEVEVNVARGLSHIGLSTRFEATRNATTLAEEYAKRLLAEALQAAQAPARYVVIDDMPGFSHEDRLKGLDIVGYQMDHERGVPVTVVKVATAAEGDRVSAKVEAMPGIRDVGQRFRPVVAKVTDDVLEALGNSWYATDPVTYLAVESAENAVVD